MNDCLLLHSSSLSLGNLSTSVSVELKPSVVSVSDHRAKAEESCTHIRCSVDSRDGDRGDEIKHRPNSAENQFDLNPRNSKEPLYHVKDVEHKQDAREPKAGHRDRIEKRSALETRVFRNFNANEAEEIEHLRVMIMNKLQISKFASSRILCIVKFNLTPIY